MFTSNPFSELSQMSAFITPAVMQGYVILMVIMVIGGTILDMIHKKSAQYFFENSKKAQKSAKRTVSSGEKASLAISTVTSEILTSSEFCNPKRRISHLFMMYGFVTFVATTAIMIFAYPTTATATPTILPMLWHVGAAMLCFGGYWFWFFIRVDVSSEGVSLFKLERADIFIVSLLTTATFGLIWSYASRQVQRLQLCPSFYLSSQVRRFLAQYSGPSSHICSLSRLRHTRRKLPRLMVQLRIYPLTSI